MDRERERVLTAYERLRVHHPALPPNLRDFQVVFHMKRRNFEGEFLFEQVDLISAMTNSEAKDQLMSDCNKYGINALAGHLVCGSHPPN